MKAPTDDEINRGIAEWAGWQELAAYAGTMKWAARYEPGNMSPVATAMHIPSYTTDENALKEALGKLDEGQKGEYMHELKQAYWRDRAAYWRDRAVRYTYQDWIVFGVSTRTKAGALWRVIQNGGKG